MALKSAIALAAALSATLTSAASIHERIVNGEDAREGEIKFIVSLRDKDGSHFCGGSLLDSTTVLTAAHCIRAGPDSVTAGSVDLEAGGVSAKVAYFKVHPDYQENYLVANGQWELNDIAILKLSTPIEKSGVIEYATLPPCGADAVVNSTAMAAGWGVQTPFILQDENANVTVARKLSKIVLPIHSRETCAKYPHIGDRDNAICAGGDGKNICNADSGGPLFDQKTGQVLGVASQSIEIRGEVCNEAPTLFSRVGSYIDFINENLGAGSGPDPGSKTQEADTENADKAEAEKQDDCGGADEDSKDCRQRRLVQECTRASVEKNKSKDQPPNWAEIMECMKNKSV